MKFQLFIVLGFQSQGQVNPILAEQRERLRRVNRLDAHPALRKALLKLAQHRGEDVLTGRRTRPNPQTGATPFAQVLQRFTRVAHLRQNLLRVMQQLLAGLG